ncbi:hypothetical protein [Streptomyces sioyaensis]
MRWFTREEVANHILEAYAVRVLDALDACAPQVRIHDGHQLLTTGSPAD